MNSRSIIVIIIILAVAGAAYFFLVLANDPVQPVDGNNAPATGNEATDGRIETGGTIPPSDEPASGSHDTIIGMTVAEATAYAEASGVPFRPVKVDGEALAVTMDFRPGRINAEIENDVVVGYTVE